MLHREDQSGWEYFEDETEKRKRMRLQIDFENKLKKELERREKSPTDEEQVIRIPLLFHTA